MLGELVLDVGDGHRPEAAEREEDDLVRLGLDLRVERLGVGVVGGENVAWVEDAERSGGVGEGDGVGLAVVEVDDEALVEAVEALDDAEAPGLVEAVGAGLAGEEVAEAAERGGEIALLPVDAVDHRDVEAVLVGGGGEELVDVLRKVLVVRLPLGPEFEEADERGHFAFLDERLLQDDQAVAEPVCVSAGMQRDEHFKQVRGREGTYLEGGQEALLDAIGRDGSGFVRHG